MTPSSLSRFLRLLTLMAAFHGSTRIIDLKPEDITRARLIVSKNITPPYSLA